MALNSRGEIDKESGETIDISNNGLAVYMNRWFEVGESCIFTLPRLGSASEGMPETEVVGVICWMREMPKGGPFRFVTGVQLRFANTDEKIKMYEKNPLKCCQRIFFIEGFFGFVIPNCYKGFFQKTALYAKDILP